MIKHAEKPKLEPVSTKKEWAVIGVLLSLLLVVGGFTLFSCYAWQKYENEFTRWHKDLTAQADRALKLPSKSLAERTEKLTTLQSLRYTAGSGTDHCNKYKMLHWQEGVDAVKQKVSKCNQLATPAGQFATDLKVVTDHLMSEKAIAAILVDTKMDDQVDEAKWAEMATHWDKIVKQLQQQKVSSTFSSTQKLAVSRADAVAKAWQDLVSANTAKDRPKYEAAVQALTTSYDRLAEIGGSAEKTLLPLLEKVRKSYEQTFENTTP